MTFADLSFAKFSFLSAQSYRSLYGSQPLSVFYGKVCAAWTRVGARAKRKVCSLRSPVAGWIGALREVAKFSVVFEFSLIFWLGF